ncbi:hypothetical protein BGX28_002231 [Mortierella sp. GBA30]|nr:hypothetical protein BGX28_002231 [Mortierella sp. GBA30]
MTRLLAISVLLLQVVITCLAIPSGYYKIRNDNGYLVVGPVPLVLPPIDVPARLSSGNDHWARSSRWFVEETNNGYTIRDGPDSPYAYFLVARNNEVWLHSKLRGAEPKVTEWSVTRAGPYEYDIKLPNEDLVVTGIAEFPGVLLEPAQGTPDQKWVFEPLEDEYRGWWRRQ